MQNSSGACQDITIAWYADDFTGAAATMEVLTFSGIPSILFLEMPSEKQLKRFPHVRGIGIASTARTQSPVWMKDHLPAIFSGLNNLAPDLVHYKVCSTLDSSPTVGSIGCAIDVGAEYFGVQSVPVMIAAPKMHRYQCFGHLFAGVNDDVMRLDRHPVMSRHPVTPMTESDVARHIGLQSDHVEGHFIPFTALKSGSAQIPGPTTSGRTAVVTLDSVDHHTDIQAGKLIWEARETCRFVVGSQGIEYALVAHWQDTGALAPVTPAQSIGRVDQMMSVSGSVSPITREQINWSRDNGFTCIEFNAALICTDDRQIEAEVERVVTLSLSALSKGDNPLVYSAAGPDDPAVAQFREAVEASGQNFSDANRAVGRALGRVLKSVLEKTGITRSVVSGGDTSGFVTEQLGIYALSALAPTIPGASICRAHSEGAHDSLELALKGGQMGTPDYFGWVRDGGGARS